MSNIAIKVENLSKQYRLGTVGTGTISHDINRWWHRIRGKEDPYLKIGESNDRASKGSSEYVWALQDINFEVQQGEVLGIIGRNGAGKSTLLKILSRTTAPTTGSIKIKGRVASLLEVGTGFHPELTGRENIYLNGAILGMTKAEISRKFDEIVDFAGVERYVDTPVKRYSSGMYVRLAFAVAAHLEPEILIVDEVLAVGDAEFQKKALGKMQEVSRGQGRTVLFVSHNMAAVSTLCQQIVLLRDGIVAYTGEVKKGLNIYLNSSNEVFDHTALEESFFKKYTDEVFELISFNITQEGVDRHNFISSKKIVFTYQYRIKKPVLGLRIGFDLIERSNETIIFRTFHDDMYDDTQLINPGIYYTVSEIEEDLLKQGSYIVNIAIGIHNVRWIIFDDIKLQMNITNIDGMNKAYADERPGLIMPKIKWRTKEIKNEYC